MGLDDALQRLDSISDDTKAGKFAADLAGHLRKMRGQITRLASKNAELDYELHQTKSELSEEKKTSARRLGEIENLLEANRRYKEMLGL